MARDLSVLVDPISDLRRPVDETLSRKAIHDQLSIAVTVVSGDHPGCEVVLLPWRERPHQDELRPVFTGQAHHHVTDEGSWIRRCPGNLPLVFPMIECLRIAHVKRRVQRALNLKQVFRVAHMDAQVGWHRAEWLKYTPIDLGKRLDHGIRRITHVRVQRTVVCIDHDLHAVPHVGRAVGQTLGIRISVARRVGVADPPQSSFPGDHQIGIVVEAQERQSLLRSLLNRAVIENPAVAGDFPGE